MSSPRFSSVLLLLDRIPLSLLVIAVVMLGVAPLGARPHLVEKVEMLAQGTLRRPIDIFDLFLHGFPIVVLAARLVRIAIR